MEFLNYLTSWDKCRSDTGGYCEYKNEFGVDVHVRDSEGEEMKGADCCTPISQITRLILRFVSADAVTHFPGFVRNSSPYRFRDYLRLYTSLGFKSQLM